MSPEATAAHATIPPDRVMPDQSSAATEHAILAEITAPLETLPEDPLAVVNADFPVALRGYDRLAVDAYVQQMAQLVAELQATRSPEAAVRRALERVGEQISGILQRAHETAEEITVQSRREAEDRLEKARIEAAEIEAAAHRRVSDLDADTDRIWAERHRIVDDARELAHQLLALAETAAERFPPADTTSERLPLADIMPERVSPAETTPYDDEAAASGAPVVGEEPATATSSEAEGGEGTSEGVDEAKLPDESGETAGDEAARPGEPGEAAPDEDGASPDAEEPAGEHGQVDHPPTADEPQQEFSEDIEKTIPFTPLQRNPDEVYREPEDITDPPEPPPAPPGSPPSNTVIPPASQAANRRSSST